MDTSNQSNRLLSVKEASAYLGLATSTLAKRRLRGDEPEFVKLGGRVFYEASALDAWIESCRRRSTSDKGIQLTPTRPNGATLL